MIHKEITLCNKTVHVAYCYATEIAFKHMSDTDINVFMDECRESLARPVPVRPDIKMTVYLVLSAMLAYYDRHDADIPVEDKDMMYDADPQDLDNALLTILTMRGEFYHVPSGEPDTEKKEGESEEDDEKNA